MYSIFLAVGPLIVLIVLNSLIILVTVYQSKRRKLIESHCIQTNHDKNGISYNNNINTKMHIENSKLISNLKFNNNVNIDNSQVQQSTKNKTALIQTFTNDTIASSSDDNTALVSFKFNTFFLYY